MSGVDTLLVTERNYLKVLLPLLDAARKSVDMLAFSFSTAGASGPPFEIAMKLKELARRGVKVRIYMEGVRETEARNRITAHFIKGAEVKYGATHAKGFCVDKRYLLIGSTNLTAQSILRNNETNVLVEDAVVVREFGRYFAHLWKGGGHGGCRLKPPMFADGAFKKELVRLIDGAEKRLEFSIYFFQQTDIERALRRAHDRGVKITGFVNQHRSFALSFVRRTRGTVSRLRAHGLDDLHFDRPDMFTHSKYMIVDRRVVFLGTGNWLQEDVDTHPQLYLRVDDPKIARALAKHLAGQIEAQATD